jgi:hypothetical protein
MPRLYAKQRPELFSEEGQKTEIHDGIEAEVALKQESAKPGDAEDFWRRVTHGIVLDNID